MASVTRYIAKRCCARACARVHKAKSPAVRPRGFKEGQVMEYLSVYTKMQVMLVIVGVLGIGLMSCLE